MDFLSAEKSKDSVCSTCAIRSIDVLLKSDPKLLFNSLLTTQHYKISKQVTRMIVTSSSFKNIIYDFIDSFAEKTFSSMIMIISRLTVLLINGIKES